jgi:hypothetical protein
VFTAGADGNGRDGWGFPWRDRVPAEAGLFLTRLEFVVPARDMVSGMDRPYNSTVKWNCEVEFYR